MKLNNKMNDATTKIQKVVRGHKIRKIMPVIKENALKNKKMNIQAEHISQKTLNDAMKDIIQEDTATNLNKLSKGMLQQERRSYKNTKASDILSKKTNISIFGKLASQTKKLKEVRQNKQIQAARFFF
jgi:hypothetical protein